MSAGGTCSYNGPLSKDNVKAVPIQATKALRTGTGIALPNLRSLGFEDGCGGVSTTPRPLYPRERPGSHCTGGWVGPRSKEISWYLFVFEIEWATGSLNTNERKRSLDNFQGFYSESYPEPNFLWRSISTSTSIRTTSNEACIVHHYL